jgi:hypothetical protein
MYTVSHHSKRTQLLILACHAVQAPTRTNIIFWQWVNQSYNAGFNYCNR